MQQRKCLQTVQFSQSISIIGIVHRLRHQGRGPGGVEKHDEIIKSKKLNFSLLEDKNNSGSPIDFIHQQSFFRTFRIQ